MTWFLRTASVLAVLIFVSCASTARPENFSLIQGTWKSSETSMRFQVSLQDGRVHIYAWDHNDAEVFEISQVSWDGTLLQATFLMPSTQHQTTARFYVESPGVLHDDYTGDAQGSMKWYCIEDE